MPVWYIFNAYDWLNFVSSLSEGLWVPGHWPQHHLGRGLASAVLYGLQTPPGVGHQVLERGVQGQRPALLVQADEELWKQDVHIIYTKFEILIWEAARRFWESYIFTNIHLRTCPGPCLLPWRRRGPPAPRARDTDWGSCKICIDSASRCGGCWGTPGLRWVGSARPLAAYSRHWSSSRWTEMGHVINIMCDIRDGGLPWRHWSPRCRLDWVWTSAQSCSVRARRWPARPHCWRERLGWLSDSLLVRVSSFYKVWG